MSAIRYKPGDKVMVRHDFSRAAGTSTYGIGVNDDMLQMKGEMLTIKKVDHNAYAVKENRWWWTDEMLEEYGCLIVEEPFRDTETETGEVKPIDIGLLKNLFTGV